MDHQKLLSAARERAPWEVRRLVGRIIGRTVPPGAGKVRWGELRRTTPIARDFGLWRGGPVDRHYIEGFLDRHRADIRGRVLEVGDDYYTATFGGDRVTRSDVLHIDPAAPGATIIGDLADPDVLPAGGFDCIVLTQTLHLIYDFRQALSNLAAALTPGGVLLMTVPGITNVDPDEWADTWHYSFTIHSVRRMCADAFPGWDVSHRGYGNVLTAVAFLHGLGRHELRPAEYEVHEPEYSIVYSARVVKPAAP